MCIGLEQSGELVSLEQMIVFYTSIRLLLWMPVAIDKDQSLICACVCLSLDAPAAYPEQRILSQHSVC